MHCSLGHYLHQRFHNLETAQFHVEHRFALVYPVERHLCAPFVCFSLRFRDVVDETSLESAVENLLLVVDECPRTHVLQFAYHAGTHVNHLLVVVGDSFVLDALFDTVFHAFIEESEQEVLCLLERKNLQLVRILNVHYLITDVVSRFHQIHQRMTGIGKRSARLRMTDNAQFIGYFLIYLLFCAEESEFAVVSGESRFERIFHYRGERGVCHYESTVATPFESVGKQTEGIGITLEVGYVVPCTLADLVFEESPFALCEERLYRLLTGMSERRVSHIVGETCRAHYRADLRKQRLVQFRLLSYYRRSHVVAQRHSHARHLQTVCETVVNEDASRQREHLSLVLHAAEGSRENQTVVVALELAAVVMALYVAVFLSEALVRNQFFPIHIENGYFVQSYKNVEKSVPISARNVLPLHPTTKYQPLL